MATTVNGFIARENYDSNWTSSEDLKKFSEISKECGNVIFGRATYEILKNEGNFPLPDRLNIVLTTNPELLSEKSNVIISNKKPRDILKLLENRGMDTAFLAGGSKINASFIKENLIDEIYITIEPLVFGHGIPLFSPAQFEKNLKLIETILISKNEIQLHYKIIK
jgi:dihydrofolate reductase